MNHADDVPRSIAAMATEDLWVVMERQHANTERMTGRTTVPTWVRAGYATARDYVEADPALTANQAARVAARNA